MTVKELIELLQSLEQDKKINIECRQCGAQYDDIKVSGDGEEYTIY